MAEGDANGEEEEVVYIEGSDVSDSESSSDDDVDDDDLPSGTSVTYGDTDYELVLPSGARIGHRAHRNVYRQNALPYLNGTPFEKPEHAKQDDTKPSAHSQALLQLVPAMMKKDKTHAPPLHAAALVPAKGGGFGTRGAGGEVIKARNRGEAKHAGKATREFADVRAFQRQANIRGEKGNNQKHVRLFRPGLAPGHSLLWLRPLTRFPLPSVPRPASAVDVELLHALAMLQALVRSLLSSAVFLPSGRQLQAGPMDKVSMLRESVTTCEDCPQHATIACR